MSTTYLNRGPPVFNSPLDHPSRHIPVKRIAPCPPSELIHAQAKRSRMVASQSSHQSLPAKNAQHNENAARTIVWGQVNCFHNVGSSVSSSGENNVKGLRFDPINSSNIVRNSVQQRSTPASDVKKPKCCPILISSSGYSTPPYCLNTSTHGKEAKRVNRRRNISQRLKKRSSENKKLRNSGGCLSILKNAAQETVKTAQACLEKNVPQPEMNALSVYHTFLRQRENAKATERCSKVSTTVTAVTRASSTLSRPSDSVQYSSNFVPQLTSTPNKGKSTIVTERLEGTSEFKKPHPPASVAFSSNKMKANSEETPLSDVLKALEEERRAGKSHISFPLEELTEMVKDLQKQQRNDVTDTSACTTSTGTTATNNNNDDLTLRIKPKIARSSLPGMYPIGAPRAASSPIASSRKRCNFAIFDESSVSAKYDGKSRIRHTAGSHGESAYSTAFSDAGNDVWRPW